MTYFADFSSACQFRLEGDPIRAIGWLSAAVPYHKGMIDSRVRAVFLDKLSNALVGERHRGFHVCEFCANEHGNGVVLVSDNQYIYAAPVMVSHYVTVHEYLPPLQFVDAVLNCPAGNDPAIFDRLRERFGDRRDGIDFVDELLNKQHLKTMSTAELFADIAAIVDREEQ